MTNEGQRPKNEYERMKHDLICNNKLTPKERKQLLILNEITHTKPSDKGRMDALIEELRSVSMDGVDNSDPYRPDDYGKNWDGHPR